MFDIGFWELLLIVIVALLVVGPDRLPKMARNIGIWIGRIRRYLNSVRADFEREIAIDEFKQSLKSQELERVLNKPTDPLLRTSATFHQETAELKTEVKGSTTLVTAAATAKPNAMLDAASPLESPIPDITVASAPRITQPVTAVHSPSTDPLPLPGNDSQSTPTAPPPRLPAGSNQSHE